MSPYYQSMRQALGTGLILMPAVVALIHNAAGHLLLQRKTDGSWSLPAGAIEPGETPEQAVAREVMEETGYVCTAVQLVQALGGAAYRHTYANGDQVEYVLLVFRCQAHPSGTGPTDLNETAGLAFFARQDLPPLALPYSLDLLFG